MPHSRHRILLVEDNPGDAYLACEWLSQAPDSKVQVTVASTLAAALETLRTQEADAIVLDLNLPDSQGLETLVEIKRRSGQAPVIVVSGRSDDELRQRATQAGAEDVFGKDETNSRLFSRSVLYVIERNRARSQQARLQALLDANPDAILVANASGRVRFVNAAAEDLFGRPRSELMTEQLAFSSGSGEAIEVTIPRADGSRSCELRLAHLDWDGEPVQMASVRDLTTRLQAEQLRRRSEDLELQNQRIQTASRLKSEFLANMSHEIRTPMNAIIGLSHLMGKTSLDEQQGSYLEKIQIASKTLLGLINDVLDLSKIEAGAVTLEDLPFDLHKLVRDLGLLMGAQAEAKGVELVVAPLTAVPRRVRGDPTRVRQVLMNLLGNAVKFTERGQVQLSVQEQPRADGRCELSFSVRDSGIGIEASVLIRLFTPFTQVDASTTRRFGGTGLGLSIVQQLVQLMGGTVTVQSEPGRGSEFTVVLPFETAAERQGGSDDASHLLDLLVVDCSGPDVQRPHRVGAAAHALGWHVERIDAFAGPVDGLTARLRAEPPIDVMMLVGSEADVERVLQACAAIAGCLSWPICVRIGRQALSPAAARDPTMPLMDLVADSRLTATALFEAVYHAWSQRGLDLTRLLRQTQLSAVDMKWLAGVSIWVVDDSDVNREVARRVLECEGASVREFGRAIDLLDALRQGSADVDAVLMDVQMPGLDGNEATRLIRQDLGLLTLPVIGLSAGAFVSERQRAIDVGMVEFVSKPLDPETLIRVIRNHVERARGLALPLQRSKRLLPQDTSTWPHIDGIDSRDVAQRLGQDLSLFASMIGRLLQEFGSLDPTVESAGLEAGGRAALAARMHKLRGSAGMLGARSIQRLAGEIESFARGQAAISEIDPAVRRLADELHRLRVEVQPLVEAHRAHRANDLARQPAASLAAEDAARFGQLLRTQDFSAVQCFEHLRAAWLARLGQQRFEALSGAIDNLDFAGALRLLAESGLVPVSVAQPDPAEDDLGSGSALTGSLRSPGVCPALVSAP